MEASHEFKLNRSVLNLTRKQRGSFLQRGENGSNSSLQAFLFSMLDPNSVEDWRPDRRDLSLRGRTGWEQDRLDDWEAEHEHSSLPDLTLGWPGYQAGLTRPGYWHAGAQNLQAGSSIGGSIGVVVECASADTRPPRHLQHTGQLTSLMVRGEDRAGLQPPVRRTSSRHDLAAADKMAASEKCPIVRPAIRLPRDLIEKMPSAPNTPVSPRKDHVASKLASGHGSHGSVTKRSPVTVASMVRR